MLRRFFGIWLGMSIGALPFFNFVICTTYALVKKKYIIGALALATGIGQITLLFSIDSGTSEKSTSYVDDFTKEIETTVDTTFVFPIDSIKLKEKLKANVQGAAINLTLRNENMKDILHRIISDTLSIYQQKVFDTYSTNIFELQKNIVSYSGEQQAEFTFSKQDRVKISMWTRDFAETYVRQESGTETSPALIMFIIVYLLGEALSVYLFMDIFAIQQKTESPAQYTNKSRKKKSPPVTEEQVTAVLDDALQTPQAEVPDSFRINFETEDKIAQLAGVGAIQAKNIVNERRDNGPFVDMKDFKSRVSLSKRVYTNLEEILNFSVPKGGKNSKGRVIEF